MKPSIINLVRDVAREWPQGVVVINPNRSGEEIFIAVNEVIMYNPSNNIHNSTVKGRDITLFVNQGGQISTSRQTVSSYIESIQWREEWELPPNIEFVWIRQVSNY